jgi:hypothetical protein
MLLDSYRQLLTAYVDGELSSRQRRHIARLLKRSAEARRLLQELQEDARALRQLPRPTLPADLTGEVLRTIAQRRLRPGRRRAASAVAASPSWMAPAATWAAAAAVLLVLGAASYLYFAASLAHNAGSDLAQHQSESGGEAPTPKPPPGDPGRDAGPRKDNAPAPQGPKPTPTPEPTPVVKAPADPPKPPATDTASGPPREDAVLTDRMEMFNKIQMADAVLPVVFRLHDLGKADARPKLLAELGKDANFRLELPCKHGTRAFERVQAAARALNLGLVIDKRAQDRLKLPPQFRTNYVVYVEDVTPDDLARFLQQISAEDRKSAARKPPEGQFDSLVLTRMTASDHKELSALLGVDPTQAAPPARGPLGTDVHQPLEGLTAVQVSQALAGQGGKPRPEPGKPAAKPPERHALVLAYNPASARPSPGSHEIKRFLDSRKPARPGTVRVLLVLRG